MGVARDYDFESGRIGLQIEVGQIMQDVNRDAPEFDEVSFRQLARPRSFVDVAADGGQRSKRNKLVENFRISDIAGMNDVLGATERLKSFWSKQSVCIGDDADLDRSSALPLEVLIRAHQLVDLGVRRRSFHH